MLGLKLKNNHNQKQMHEETYEKLLSMLEADSFNSCEDIADARDVLNRTSYKFSTNPDEQDEIASFLYDSKIVPPVKLRLTTEMFMLIMGIFLNFMLVYLPLSDKNGLRVRVFSALSILPIAVEVFMLGVLVNDQRKGLDRI